MPEPIQRTLKVIGVTPWQLILVMLTIGFYFGEAKPRLDSIPILSQAVKEVGDSLKELKGDVRVHESLLRGLQEVKEEQSQIRQKVYSIEGRLAHVKFYGGAEP